MITKLRYYFNFFSLPIILAVIFVFQNHFFNLWLNISVRHYFIRRSIISFSLGLLIFGLVSLLAKKLKYIYLALASLVISVIFIFQYLYYSYSGGFLQTSALFYAGEGTTVLGTIKVLLNFHLFFFLIGPGIIMFVWLLSNRNLIIEKTLLHREKIIIGFLIILFAIIGYGYLFAREYVDAGNVTNLYQYNKIYDINDLETKLGIINFSIGDALSFALRQNKVNASEISFIQSFKNQLPAALQEKNFGQLKGRNLIIIQVESLENAVINQAIYGQEITPNLNKLAKQGLYFPHYYAPIGPGTTADTEFMALNSLYSLPDTVAFISYAQNKYTALPNLLKNNGYHTYSFHGDISSFWNRSNIYPQLGYEKWFDQKDFLIKREIGPYKLDDKDFFTQSIPKLQTLPQPFMASFITLTSHTPFELPPDLETLNIPASTTLNWLQAHYLQNIHYTDQNIGNFIEQLKEAGLYENSLILIYGDHGSFTGISNALGFNNSIFPELQETEVPMIILAPGTSLQGDKNNPSSHLDIYPTVANLLGVKPPATMLGHDMLKADSTTEVSRNLISGTLNSIVTNKLAYHSASDGIFEHGLCLQMPTKKTLNITSCQTIFNQENDAIKASDLMIKGNLID